MVYLVSALAIMLIVLYRKKMAMEWYLFRTQRRDWLKLKWKNWGEPFVVAAILAIIIRTFLLGPYKIPTGSMRMTFIEGDRIFVDKVSYHFTEPKRGDIIVFKYPEDEGKDFVKRLVGFPGDQIKIQAGRLIINGEEINEPPFSGHYYYNREDWAYGKTGQIITVPEDSFFVLGDNSAASSDSRNWGFVPKKNLIGRAFVIWWPPERAKIVR